MKIKDLFFNLKIYLTHNQVFYIIIKLASVLMYSMSIFNITCFFLLGINPPYWVSLLYVSRRYRNTKEQMHHLAELDKDYSYLRKITCWSREREKKTHLKGQCHEIFNHFFGLKDSTHMNRQKQFHKIFHFAKIFNRKVRITEVFIF